MSLRKEQVLLIAVAALLVLLAVTANTDQVDYRRRPVKPKGYDSVTLPDAVVVDGVAVDVSRVKDIGQRPTRTKPLPPPDWPELALPPFPKLPIVGPPLDAGPGLRFWHLARIDTTALTVALPAEAQASGSGDQEGPVPDGGRPLREGRGQDSTDDTAKDHSRTYDQLQLSTRNRPLWGRILGADRHQRGQLDQSNRLQLRPPFRAPVSFQEINPDRGTVVVAEFAYKPEEVVSITFANNIQNRIALMRRRIPPRDTGLRDRERFIHELLTVEREHPEALLEAETQANEYIEAAPSEPRGPELLAHVYATTGQLEKELATYEQLGQGRFKAHAFVARGLGVLKQRLQLFEDAERHLRDAVRADGQDARNHFALSRFLLERGRARESAAVARTARSLLGAGLAPHETHEILAHTVHALLAVGDNDEAAAALAAAQNVTTHPELEYLAACVSYAKGEYEDARTAFQGASAALPLSAMPLIGAGLCAFRLADYKGALQAFQAAADRDPLERHVALAAQAFVYLLAPGRIADAVGKAEEAKAIAPRDPYVLYLLGRAYREAGQLAEARAVLNDCLREHHDFVEAMVELAWTQLVEARQAQGQNFFDLLERAERLAARAAAEEAQRGKEWRYQDLLGVVRYHRNKTEPARRAFDMSRKWGGDLHARIWKALLRNRLGHIDDAIVGLRQVSQLIRDEKDPFKVYADTTRGRLRYHRGKRSLVDAFTTRAKHWTETKSGQRQISWRIVDGRMRVRGTATREGATRMRFRVERTKDFVSAEIDLGVLGGDAAVTMRVSNERDDGKGQTSLEARAGWRYGGGWVYLRTQRAENDKTTTDIRQTDRPEIALRPGEKARLKFERFMGIDGAARKGAMIVSWNGVEVARRPLSTSSDTRSLQIDLHVECQIGEKVDSWFDNMRLVLIGAE